jgi:hypothetical protein
VVLDNDGKYGSQIWAPAQAGSAPNLYIRKKDNDVYGSWAKVWHSANDGAGSGLDADLLAGIASTTYSESLRANRNISGGGTITVDASYNVLWSSRFIIISNGSGSNFSTSGYFDIDCPLSGTITGVGGAGNVTATAAGIPLGAWQAIYYILPIGSNNASVAANFRVAGFGSDLDIPHNWVLICVRNSDNGAVTFNNGITLSNGQSLSSIQQATANTVNTLVRRDASGNFTAGTITATTFSGSGASLTSIPNSATTATSANTPSAIVARDGSGNFTAGSITITGLNGNGIGGSSGNYFTKVPVVASDGVMEVGRFIDFHNTSGDTTDFTYRLDNGSNGVLACSGSLLATQFTSLSDVNKKKNIRPIENAIDITKKLEGVRFDWIDNDTPSIGVIAQQVEKVLPELVVENDGIKSVSYGNIVGVLIEAIKEQQFRFDVLE